MQPTLDRRTAAKASRRPSCCGAHDDPTPGGDPEHSTLRWGEVPRGKARLHLRTARSRLLSFKVVSTVGQRETADDGD
jgi:hypothetical protein